MTMRGGPSQVIDIQTIPPGAKVIIQPAVGEFESPARVSLHRKLPYTVTVSKPGFKTASVPIENKISKGTWLRNIMWIHPLFWGAGVIVDLSTGAGYELIPKSISIEMEALTESQAR